MPETTAYDHWLWSHQMPEITVDLSQEDAVTVEQRIIFSQQDERLTITYVDHALVVEGDQKSGMAYAPLDEDDTLGTCTNGIAPQDRTKPLVAALLKDSASGVRHLKVRIDNRPHVNQDGKKTIHPYNLIDIQMQDGSQSRVIVCDFKGYVTYVHRNAPDMDDTSILQISDLKQDSKVWRAVHFTQEQWISSIQQLLYTPVESLEADPKSRNSRWGMEGVLKKAFVNAVIRTGTLPPTQGTQLVREAPLAGLTRWSNLYRGINSGAVHKLTKGSTWRTLFAAITGKDGEYPALKEFMGRPIDITARDIHLACSRFQQEFGLAVQTEFYDDLKVRGLSGHAVDLALKFEQVSGWEEFLPQGAPAPIDLEDFVVRSGLAKRNGMQLIAA